MTAPAFGLPDWSAGMWVMALLAGAAAFACAWHVFQAFWRPLFAAVLGSRGTPDPAERAAELLAEHRRRQAPPGPPPEPMS